MSDSETQGASTTFPRDDELEEIEDGLPPAPDPTEIVPPSAERPLAPGELEQHDRQYDARLQREGAAREVRTLESQIEELSAQYKTGYLRITRIGPPDLPRTEIGDVGKVKLKDLGNHDLQEVVRGLAGGGEYSLVAYTGRGKAVTTDPMLIEIAGDIHPKSRDGEEHLRRKSVGNVSPEASGMDKVAAMLEKQAERSGGGDMLAILAAVTTPMQTMMQTLLAQQNSSKERELAEIKAKAERELAELKAKSEREERESREKLERERMASEERVKLAVEETKARQSDAKYREKYSFLTEKTRATLGLKSQEMQMAGPLGVQGHKILQGRLVETLVEKALEQYGLSGAPDDERSDFGAQFMQTVVQPLVEKHGDKAIAMVERLLTPKGAAAPAAPAPARGLPGAPAGAPPSPGPADAAAAVDVDAAPDAPQGAPADASAPAGAPADGAAAEVSTVEFVNSLNETLAARVAAFLQAVLREMAIESEPASAWEADLVEDRAGRTVEQGFERLSELHRRMFPSGWLAFKPTLPLERFGQLVAMFDRALSNEPAEAWFQEFLANGPWTEGEDVEE